MTPNPNESLSAFPENLQAAIRNLDAAIRSADLGSFEALASASFVWSGGGEEDDIRLQDRDKLQQVLTRFSRASFPVEAEAHLENGTATLERGGSFPPTPTMSESVYRTDTWGLENGAWRIQRIHTFVDATVRGGGSGTRGV